jgi:predicted acyltransferase
MNPPLDRRLAMNPSHRLVSLDQFRGYTVLGMFFVNFVGGFQAVPAIFKHHNTYCSYADTIMPHFFFAVGFAYRMTLLRRLASDGPAAAYGKVVRRCLGLVLIGAVIYHLDGGVKNWTELETLGVAGFLKQSFQRNLFQTLVHIGVTSLWVMPVMAARPAVLTAFAAGSAVLHVVLSHWFYYEFAMNRPVIDGGPLGFLTWTVPLAAGAIAHDLLKLRPGAWQQLLGWGGVLMLAGYSLSCLNAVTSPAGLKLGPQPSASDAASRSLLIEPPFVPPSRPINLWTMSQRAGSASYLVFGAGCSLAVFAGFVWACDVRTARVGIFATLGANALAGYIIHDLVAEAIKPYAPKDSPLWFALAAFGLFLAITYLLVRYLERNNIFIRL